MFTKWPMSASPVRPIPHALRTVRWSPSAPIRYWARTVLVWPPSRATIVARDGGQTSTVRAQYLIGADGDHRTVRKACGIGRTGDADMGHFVNIFHRAPLGPLVRDRPGWSYSVITPQLAGALVAINGDDVWLFHVNLAPGETVEDFTEERCVETIRGAAGVEDLDVEILSIKSWIMGAELSTAFRN